MLPNNCNENLKPAEQVENASILSDMIPSNLDPNEELFNSKTSSWLPILKKKKVVQQEMNKKDINKIVIARIQPLNIKQQSKTPSNMLNPKFKPRFAKNEHGNLNEEAIISECKRELIRKAQPPPSFEVQRKLFAEGRLRNTILNKRWEKNKSFEKKCEMENKLIMKKDSVDADNPIDFCLEDQEDFIDSSLTNHLQEPLSNIEAKNQNLVLSLERPVSSLKELEIDSKKENTIHFEKETTIDTDTLTESKDTPVIVKLKSEKEYPKEENSTHFEEEKINTNISKDFLGKDPPVIGQLKPEKEVTPKEKRTSSLKDVPNIFEYDSITIESKKKKNSKDKCTPSSVKSKNEQKIDLNKKENKKVEGSLAIDSQLENKHAKSKKKKSSKKKDLCGSKSEKLEKQNGSKVECFSLKKNKNKKETVSKEKPTISKHHSNLVGKNSRVKIQLKNTKSIKEKNYSSDCKFESPVETTTKKTGEEDAYSSGCEFESPMKTKNKDNVHGKRKNTSTVEFEHHNHSESNMENTRKKPKNNKFQKQNVIEDNIYPNSIVTLPHESESKKNNPDECNEFVSSVTSEDDQEQKTEKKTQLKNKKLNHKEDNSMQQPRKRNYTKTPRNINLSNPIYTVPLKNGWKRELVIRATQTKRKGDVYYYTPNGDKLRSRADIKRYFAENEDSSISIESFIFFPEPLGVDGELIRSAFDQTSVLANRKLRKGLSAPKSSQKSYNKVRKADATSTSTSSEMNSRMKENTPHENLEINNVNYDKVIPSIDDEYKFEDSEHQLATTRKISESEITKTDFIDGKSTVKSVNYESLKDKDPSLDIAPYADEVMPEQIFVDNDADHQIDLDIPFAESSEDHCATGEKEALSKNDNLHYNPGHVENVIEDVPEQQFTCSKSNVILLDNINSEHHLSNNEQELEENKKEPELEIKDEKQNVESETIESTILHQNQVKDEFKEGGSGIVSEEETDTSLLSVEESAQIKDKNQRIESQTTESRNPHQNQVEDEFDEGNLGIVSQEENIKHELSTSLLSAEESAQEKTADSVSEKKQVVQSEINSTELTTKINSSVENTLRNSEQESIKDLEQCPIKNEIDDLKMNSLEVNSKTDSKCNYHPEGSENLSDEKMEQRHEQYHEISKLDKSDSIVPQASSPQDNMENNEEVFEGSNQNLEEHLPPKNGASNLEQDSNKDSGRLEDIEKLSEDKLVNHLLISNNFGVLESNVFVVGSNNNYRSNNYREFDIKNTSDTSLEEDLQEQMKLSSDTPKGTDQFNQTAYNPHFSMASNAFSAVSCYIEAEESLRKKQVADLIAILGDDEVSDPDDNLVTTFHVHNQEFQGNDLKLCVSGDPVETPNHLIIKQYNEEDLKNAPIFVQESIAGGNMFIELKNVEHQESPQFYDVGIYSSEIKRDREDSPKKYHNSQKCTGDVSKQNHCEVSYVSESCSDDNNSPSAKKLTREEDLKNVSIFVQEPITGGNMLIELKNEEQQESPQFYNVDISSSGIKRDREDSPKKYHNSQECQGDVSKQSHCEVSCVSESCSDNNNSPRAKKLKREEDFKNAPIFAQEPITGGNVLIELKNVEQQDSTQSYNVDISSSGIKRDRKDSPEKYHSSQECQEDVSKQSHCEVSCVSESCSDNNNSPRTKKLKREEDLKNAPIFVQEPITGGNMLIELKNEEQQESPQFYNVDISSSGIKRDREDSPKKYHSSQECQEGVSKQNHSEVSCASESCSDNNNSPRAKKLKKDDFERTSNAADIENSTGPNILETERESTSITNSIMVDNLP